MTNCLLSTLCSQHSTQTSQDSRRDFLRIGGLSALGIGLADWFGDRRAYANSPTIARRAEACILIWLDGGPSHLETFDPKPDAPVEVRGPFQSISTSLPGVAISEWMPQLAQRLDRVALIRSMTSTLGEHNLATHYLLTGYRPTPALDYPSFGSVLASVRPSQGDLPDSVAIPHYRVGGGKFAANGYLPASTAPLQVGSDPAKPGFQVDGLTAYPGITGPRFDQRRRYLRQLERFQRAAESDSAAIEAAGTATSQPAFEQAYRLMTSPGARQAFELEREPAKLRQQYGRKTIGQSCLLARRLVEHGVPLVTVNNTGWDTHENLVTRLKDGYTGARTPVGLVPSLDLAVSTLLDDLNDRGLLDTTLVVVMGEFGRTPKLNAGGGRDHWPRVFSVLVAGAGIAGGQVIGASDEVGESPEQRPVSPVDFAATVYRLLGINPQATLSTADGRPVPINQGGVPLPELV